MKAEHRNAVLIIIYSISGTIHIVYLVQSVRITHKIQKRYDNMHKNRIENSSKFSIGTGRELQEIACNPARFVIYLKG